MSTPFYSTIFAFALGVGLSFAGAPGTAQEETADFPQVADFSAIVAELSPSVVGISARGMRERSRQMPEGMPGPFGDMPGPFGGDPFGGDQFGGPFGSPFGGQDMPPREIVALGSGFMISQDGHIVTNNHVIADAVQIEVLLEDGTALPAELIGTDPATDIAVLRIEESEGLSVAEWGDSQAMQPGAWTIAIGSPFGLGGTVTVGVLSALSRDIRVGPYDDFLQTDASINSGNSGGPLFNASGEVIGVNTAIFSPGGGNVGIGFAIPSNVAQAVVSELIDEGTVQRGFIGVTLQIIDDALARALELDTTDGAIVAGLEDGAPAQDAGLREGDVLLEVDGETIESPRALARTVADLTPGEDVPFTVFRDGEEIEVTLTIAEREGPSVTPAAEMEDPSPEAAMGLALSPLPELVRRNLDLAEGVGLLIQQVAPASPAAEADLRRGDVIVTAGGQTVSDPSVLSEAWAQARDDGRPLLLRVNRMGNVLFAAVEPAEADQADEAAGAAGSTPENDN